MQMEDAGRRAQGARSVMSARKQGRGGGSTCPEGTFVPASGVSVIEVGLCCLAFGAGSGLSAAGSGAVVGSVAAGAAADGAAGAAAGAAGGASYAADRPSGCLGAGLKLSTARKLLGLSIIPSASPSILTPQRWRLELKWSRVPCLPFSSGFATSPWSTTRSPVSIRFRIFP